LEKGLLGLQAKVEKKKKGNPPAEPLNWEPVEKYDIRKFRGEERGGRLLRRREGATSTQRFTLLTSGCIGWEEKTDPIGERAP